MVRNQRHRWRTLTSLFRTCTTTLGPGILLLFCGCRAPIVFSEGEQLPVPRTEVQVATIGTRLYVVGGYPKATNARVDVYDAGTHQWAAAAPLPVGGDHLAVASGGGSIFVFGGCCADAARDSNFATAYRYDTAANRWSTVSPLPAPCAAAAAAYLDGKVHIVGGDCQAGNTERDVERHLVFNPVTGTYADAAPIPWARNHLALVVAGDRLYALGGRQATKTNETASVLVYDADANRWTAVSPMPAKRSGIAAAFSNGKIYVFGGDNGTEAHQLPSHREIFVYDVSANKWVRASDLPYGVHGTGAAVLGGKIYLPGGSPMGGHDEPLRAMLVVTP